MSVGDFFGSIFGGQNKTLNQDINKFGSIGDFATGMGEGSLTKATNFFSDIVSGDPSKISKTLGPEIATIQNQTQQQKKTNAEFNNRGGGTNASNVTASDKARGTVSSLVSSLLGGAASALGTMGSSLLSQGSSAYGEQADLSQVRMQNWQNSILGQGTSFGAGFLEGKGLTKLFPTKKSSN